MLEAAQLIAIAAAVLLALAVAVWLKLLRGPAVERLGASSIAHSGKAERASRLLVFAAIAGALAALVAIAAFISA